MKKITRIAALLAAGALLFGAVGCSSGGGGSDSEEKEEEKKEPDLSVGENAAVFTFLKDIKGGSSTAAAEEGFFAGAKAGDLAVTVSDIELQLYKSGTGWTKIDASASSTKAAGSNNMLEGPAYISGQFSTRANAQGVSNDLFKTGDNAGWELGRVKLTVKAGDDAVVLKKLSGYFASGKTFEKGFVKVGENEYVELTVASKLTAKANNPKGIVVTDFEVNQTIPANAERDIYISLGKAYSSQPTDFSIDVAEVVYEFAAADAPAVLVGSITVSAADDATTVDAGGTLQFSAEVKAEDEDATPDNTDVEWSALDENGEEIDGVSIDEDGLLSVEASVTKDTKIVVKAKAKDASGVESNEVKITVNANVPVASIEITATKGDEVLTLGEENAPEIEAGDVVTFKAVCKGADGAEPSNGEVTWSAKIGEAEATDVIKDGVFTAPVHADADKTYTITATAKDESGTTGTAKIIVKKLEPLEVNVKETYTEYFDGKANIYIDSAFSGIFAGGTLGTDSTNGKKTTYEFTSGVKWVPGTGGKIETNDTIAKTKFGETYTAKYRLSLDKPANNAPLTVPVKGACTVVLGFQNNKDSRGFTVESTDATLSNATVDSYDGTTKQESADATIESSNSDKTLTLKFNGNGVKSANELVSFDVSVADTLTIKTTDGKDDKGGNSAGTVYIYFIDVKTSATEE